MSTIVMLEVSSYERPKFLIYSDFRFHLQPSPSGQLGLGVNTNSFHESGYVIMTQRRFNWIAPTLAFLTKSM